MKLTAAAIASAFVVGGAGMALAAPATAADANVLGTYTFEAENGESATWTLTPCADDTDGCVRVSETGSSKRTPWSADAHWTVGSWIMFAQQSDAILCEDGTAAPGLNTYSWDGGSLSGSASIFSRGACGAEPASVSIPFALTKTGSGPVQYPTAPVQVEPYIVDVPPPYVPPGQQAGPMPAESDPALIAVPAVIPGAGEPLTEAEVAQPGFNANPGRR